MLLEHLAALLFHSCPLPTIFFCLLSWINLFDATHISTNNRRKGEGLLSVSLWPDTTSYSLNIKTATVTYPTQHPLFAPLRFEWANMAILILKGTYIVGIARMTYTEGPSFVNDRNLKNRHSLSMGWSKEKNHRERNARRCRPCWH